MLLISITHNKNLNPLVPSLINYITARSASQILSVKDECTFLFSNFLIIGLCNSSAICLLDIISFLIAPAEAFLSKKFINHWLKQVHVDIYHVSHF